MSARSMAVGESYFICSDAEPVELNAGSGDVLFPICWTVEMASNWRERNITPGPEWPPRAPGQRTSQ